MFAAEHEKLQAAVAICLQPKQSRGGFCCISLQPIAPSNLQKSLPTNQGIHQMPSASQIYDTDPPCCWSTTHRRRRRDQVQYVLHRGGPIPSYEINTFCSLSLNSNLVKAVYVMYVCRFQAYSYMWPLWQTCWSLQQADIIRPK